MNYTDPGFIYIMLAILLCVIYYGLEEANGGLGFTGKTIICSWSIISLLVMSIIFGYKAAKEAEDALGIPDEEKKIKSFMPMYLMSYGTLALSSVCISLVN
jgi:hypothetical protein